MKVKLMLGDCLEQMKRIPDNYVDSIVTDPPANIAFMGKNWDDFGSMIGFQDFMCSAFTEAFRVIKPGGHLFVWAIPRTSHHTAMGLERAGFEIRDVVTHVFGSGFPKSHNISKAIDKQKYNMEHRAKAFVTAGRGGKQKDKDTGEELPNPDTKIEKFTSEEAKQWEGWGTGLKPASEHWILCRKPLTEKTIADNVLKWGVGGINIDKSRIETTDKYRISVNEHKTIYMNSANNKVQETRDGSEDGGRFPSNFIHDGSDEVMEEFDKAGNRKSTKFIAKDTGYGKSNTYINYKEGGSLTDVDGGYTDEGSAARFFYCSKASGKEKNEGLEDFESKKDTAGTERNGVYVNDQGRFPANFIHDGSDEVMEEFDKAGIHSAGKKRQAVELFTKDKSLFNIGREGGASPRYGDEGSAARFFYCSKASGKEKNEGLEDFESKKDTGIGSTYAANQETSKIGGNPNKPTKPSKCTHPTVKPIKLMSYLINMITPPNGIVLDPFMGSGSTGVAAVKNGFNFIGIEKEPEYMEIAKARIEFNKKGVI